MTDRNKPKSTRMKAGAPSKARDRGAQGSDDARAPVKRADLMSNLRWALKASANHIAVVGAAGNAAQAFLGDAFKDEGSFGADEIDPDAIQLDRFAITPILDRAYDFAFQTGARSHRHEMNGVEYLRLLTFRRGSPQFVWGGVDTPMGDDSSPICRTIDTADARMRLLWGFGLTVRQLALLANMSEPAVRTSLSKEDIRTTSARNDGGDWNVDRKLTEVPDEDARRWLGGRRGFIPTLKPEPCDCFYTDDVVRILKSNGFEGVLDSIPGGEDVSTTAREAGVDPEWLLEMASGRPASLDIEALNRVAERLRTDAPAFVGRAVEMILRANTKKKGAAGCLNPEGDQ